MFSWDPFSRSYRIGVARLRFESNGIVSVDNNCRHAPFVLRSQYVLLEPRCRLVVEHELAHYFRRNLRHFGRRKQLRIRSFRYIDSRLDQRRRRLFKEVDDAAEILRVRIPHLKLVWAHRGRLFAVVRHHPPVATRSEGACVVLDRHDRCGKRTGLDDGPVVLVFVDVAVFVGDADATNEVRSIVLDFDKGGAFGEAEGEGDETKGKKELWDLWERMLPVRGLEDCWFE